MQGLLKDCEKVIGRSVQEPKLLGDNKYCSIYQVTLDGAPIIVKKYKTEDARLATLEAVGVDVYHRVSQKVDGLMDGKTLFLDEESNLVGFSFVPGERLSDYIHRVADDRNKWGGVVDHMFVLGKFLVSMREETIATDAVYDPFHEEYFVHCRRELRSLPGLGALFFPRATVDSIDFLKALNPKVEHPSRAHGDFVFRNIHVHEGMVGIIDFANTIPHSHPLNDMMNLWFALQNMWIPCTFREKLWVSFLRGYGPVASDSSLLEFFHEYHRRRWLMLNLKTRDPKCWLRASRGLLTFARSRGFPSMESGQ